MDHTVGLVASQGRVYPRGVFDRMQHSDSTVGPSSRGATEQKDSSYLSEDVSPLAEDRIAHDSGICAGAFVVPVVEGSRRSSEEDRGVTRARNRNYTNLEMRKIVGYTPLERLFDVAIATAVDKKTIRDFIVDSVRWSPHDNRPQNRKGNTRTRRGPLSLGR